MGSAVKHSSDDKNFYLNDADKIISAAYGLPFFFVVAILIVTFFVVWHISLEEVVNSVRENHSFQANLIAAVMLCFALVLFTAALDIKSCIIDISEMGLPSYYDNNKDFLRVTIISLIVYLLFFIVGLYWFFLEILLLVAMSTLL